MTWSTYKKKFEPTIYSRTDSTFGTKSIVDPTMQKAGFNHVQIMDIDEHYEYKAIVPIDIVKDQIDIYKYTYIIYYVWKHRDFHGRGIDIYYR